NSSRSSGWRLRHGLPVAGLNQIRVIGMLEQHPRGTTLKEFCEAGLLIFIRLPGHGLHEKRPHGWVRWYFGQVEIEHHTAAGIAPPHRQKAIDGCVELEQAPAREAAAGPEAAKASLRRGASDQHRDGCNHARRPLLAPIPKIDLYASAFGKLVAIEIG